ncbi:MAG: DUF2752 domain-containing protein [Gemmatimonadota bacterium]|nr:DUF2752 domain-containing protein [Gemmatimonadota bacterium]
MKAPTVSSVHLARIFLVGLALVAVLLAWFSPVLGATWPVLCPFRFFTHLPCPGCGMGRACIALAQGNLTDAWHYHPFAFFLVPLALALACFPSRFGRAWLALPLSLRRVLAGGVLALVLALWGYRLLLV